MDRELNIAKEFTFTPGPRYKDEGLFSAELLHEILFDKVFEEVIKSNGTLTVNLDGTLGYGTSFLEELFGGAVRRFGYKDVKNRIRYISHQEPYLVDDINEYIEDAKE